MTNFQSYFLKYSLKTETRLDNNIHKINEDFQKKKWKTK